MGLCRSNRQRDQAHLKAARSYTRHGRPPLARRIRRCVAECQSCYARASLNSAAVTGATEGLPQRTPRNRAGGRAGMLGAEPGAPREGWREGGTRLSLLQISEAQDLCQAGRADAVRGVPRAHDESREAREARLHHTRMMDRLVKLLREEDAPGERTNLARGSGAPPSGEARQLWASRMRPSQRTGMVSLMPCPPSPRVRPPIRWRAAPRPIRPRQIGRGPAGRTSWRCGRHLSGGT